MFWFLPNWPIKDMYSVTSHESDPLDATQVKLLQRVVGKFLYYSRAADPTMGHILSILASSQSGGQQSTMDALVHFLDYCATHPDAKLRYVCSDMILHVESDASYLTEPKARSRAGGRHYLGNQPGKPPILNGPILDLSKAIKHVMSSAAEAEIGSLFMNLKEATVLRMTLEEMGHPQPPTPVATNNSTAAGIANRTVKQQRSKAINMRFYWVRDRVDQKQFSISWLPGKTNIADYFTKHHSPAHHRMMRPIILNQVSTAEAYAYLQGCVDSPSKGLPPKGNPEVQSSGLRQPAGRQRSTTSAPNAISST